MDPAVRSRGGHPSALSVPRGGETVTEAVPLAACGDACDGAAVADGPCPEVPPPSPPMPAFAETHPRCMPCYGSRLLASPMVGVVFGLALLTFVPYVVLNPHMDTVALTCKVVLTALLSLMLASYVQCVWIDAGTVPNWWLERAETAPEGEYQRCRRTNLPKPPRSHYDSSTKRLVLNMDHFCPWVANTVGFYNRKFFVLFLIYTTLACCFAATTSVMVFGDMVFPSSTCKRTHTCTRSSLMLFAIVIDGMFGILLVFFAGFHVSMALTNETTIESFAGPYDIGFRGNWEQVFGKDPRYWFLPVWGSGPSGDGLTWPVNDPDLV